MGKNNIGASQSSTLDGSFGKSEKSKAKKYKIIGLVAIICVLGISIKEFYYGEKMFEQEFKFLSEQHLRMYLIEKYGRRLRLKFAVLGGIIGMLIFIIIQLTFNR